MNDSRPSLAQQSSGTLAFLFTDLAGSTRLWERFPNVMSDALKRHDVILREAIGASGGHVVKSTGDGMMAVFPAVADGVAASLAAQLALADTTWTETGALRVRMGLHAGEADQRGDDYFGPTVNRTARIMSAGHGGQVLLSAAAAALVADRLPSGATLRDLGEHRLKDLGRPERVFQLQHPALDATFPPLTTLDRGSSNLPIQAAALVGRRAELVNIAGVLEDPSVRLLTLTGPGGTGKTSLAVRAAVDQVARFKDGVFFVDLSAARNTDSVLIALARVLRLGEVIDRPLLEELTDRLRDRQVLLVLDNFEQVIEAAGVATHLLSDCPGVSLLVTSREALHVRAERVYPVPPLSLPPSDERQASAAHVVSFAAVELLVERARAVRADFQLTNANAAAVAEICRRLDGLPLAIELAAARLRLFSPETLRDRLGSRLELLRSSARDLPLRQQTLRATIEWSYQLLEPREQWLFELLAVFSDADFAAVESVASEALEGDGSGVDVLDGLASLLDKSLIRQVEEAHAEPRLLMLETIREFATDRLSQRSDFGPRVRRAHAAYYADLALRQRSDLVGSKREEALIAMASEVENLRVAWRHWVAEADLDQLNKLADSLLILNDARGWYLDTVGLTTDLLTVLAAASSSPELLSQEIALRTSLARALMATRGFTPEVAEAYGRALALFEGGTELRQHASVLRGLATLYVMRAEFDKTAGLGEQILGFAEQENDPGLRVDGHLLLGFTLAFDGKLRAGLQHLDLAIGSIGSSPARAHGLRLGNDPRVACLTTSAFTLWLLGFPDQAAERARSAITLSARLDHPFTAAYAQFHVGLLHLWLREPEVVLDRALRLLEIADEHDFQIWAAVGTCLLGVAQAGLGRHEIGLAEIRKGMDQYQGLRTPPVFWPMLLFLEAGAYGLGHQPAQGLSSIDAAIDSMNPGGQSSLLPELYLLKGDLLAGPDSSSAVDRSDADHWYRLAFQRAGDMEARMSELRAATRLCRHPPDRGQANDRVRDLRAVLNTFTEGFRTADLIEARQILSAMEG